jgi:acyl-CoA hydrolase
LIKLIEEVGFIVATRQMNVKPREKVTLGALARIERLDFRLPVEIGDVVAVRGGVTYATPHSCQVALNLEATRVMNPNSGRDEGRRLTNTAKLW